MGPGLPKASLTVLLVDDEPAVRAVVAAVLRLDGHTVLEAADPSAGLALGDDRAAPPDLLISDVTLPGFDGPELARRLHEKWPDLPVLLISGYVARALTRCELDSLAADFLQKPFTPAELSAKVRELTASS